MPARALSRATLSGLILASAAHAQPVAPRITILTTPPGAKVYVDGKEKGIACQSGPNCKPRMSRGTHRVTMELDGYKALEETINVAGPQTLTFALQPAPARLNIKTLATNQAAHGGELFIDGKLAGSVPTEIEVPPGKHMIEVRRPGYQPYSEAIEVKGGELHPLFIALNAEAKGAPTTGALMITSELSAAEVIVDEQPRGPAPVLVESLSPGDHVVEIRPKDPSYQPWRRNVRVSAGQQAAAYATFTANPPPAPAPVPSGEPAYPVAFVPRSASNNYVVTLPSGQSCATPCTLQLPPGGQVVSVSGPGSNAFREPVNIPNVPAQVTVQHFTTGRLVGGIIMAALGIPMIALGSIYLGDPRPYVSREFVPATAQQSAIIGGVLVGGGAALTLGSIVSLALIKTNRAEVHALGPIGPKVALRPRLFAPSVAPTVDRADALGRVAF